MFLHSVAEFIYRTLPLSLVRLTIVRLSSMSRNSSHSMHPGFCLSCPIHKQIYHRPKLSKAPVPPTPRPARPHFPHSNEPAKGASAAPLQPTSLPHELWPPFPTRSFWTIFFASLCGSMLMPLCTFCSRQDLAICC